MPKQQPDGIDNVVIDFTKENRMYRSGSNLEGKVTVIVDETTPIRAIKLKIFGRMNIYWRKMEGGSTVEFAEIEDYIDENIVIWTPNPKKKEELWTFPGTHTFPFSFDLPVDLPDTMEDSRYAKINYTCKAGVYLTQGRATYSLEEPFYIVTVPDPSVPKPSDEDLPKENVSYGVIGGTCFMKKTHVELYLKLERNVYKLGETIPVHVECTVVGGSADVDKVTALLVQEGIYTCNMGMKDETRKKERLVMAEDEDKEDTDVGETQNYELQLTIPDRMPLTDFPWCDFIEMGYFVHVVARTHSFYDDIVVKLPLIIEGKDDDDFDKVSPENDEEGNETETEQVDDETSVAMMAVVDADAEEGNEMEEEHGEDEANEEENKDDDENDEKEEKDGDDEEKEVDDLLEEIEA